MFLRLTSALAALSLAFAVHAQRAPEEGLDFNEIKPARATESPGKVEVVEFFWYRCPHCYALEPDLEAWAKRLPPDVAFRRVPGILNDDWAIDARIFYTLEALGELDRLHRPFFDAIHREGGVRLRGGAFLKWAGDWFGKHKVDKAKYDAALHSFSVETKLRRAIQMSRDYRLDGVPTLTVQGKYIVLARSTMLATTSYLIGESRKQLGKR